MPEARRTLRAIKDEPAAATYLALIRFAAAQASTFSLTWRHELDFDAGLRLTD